MPVPVTRGPAYAEKCEEHDNFSHSVLTAGYYHCHWDVSASAQRADGAETQACLAPAVACLSLFRLLHQVVSIPKNMTAEGYQALSKFLRGILRSPSFFSD